ncbi:MAG: hypothetical protein H0X11_10975 [Betaproteobacteria bacterium]|nr:hypothetical protein [Betaproteobacteria bacterium]
MPYRANYPATVTEVLDDSITFNPAAIRAVRALARAKPWRGEPRIRALKIAECFESLAEAYNLDGLRITFCTEGADCYIPGRREIRLHGGQLSVVTFLHEFGHARGFDERRTCRWSINLFRKCFPRSFARCRQVGHMLVNDSGR